MAETASIEYTVYVTVPVKYRSQHYLDERRVKFIEQKLQEFVDTSLRDTLAVLRFQGE